MITVMIVLIASSSILIPLFVCLFKPCENYTDSIDKIKFEFMNRLVSKYQRHYLEVQQEQTEVLVVVVAIHPHIRDA